MAQCVWRGVVLNGCHVNYINHRRSRVGAFSPVTCGSAIRPMHSSQCHIYVTTGWPNHARHRSSISGAVHTLTVILAIVCVLIFYLGGNMYWMVPGEGEGRLWINKSWHNTQHTRALTHKPPASGDAPRSWRWRQLSIIWC